MTRGAALGPVGERLAASWVRSRGMLLLDRNWRDGRRELDLVVRDGDAVAFIEVKTRRPGPQPAIEAVSPGKRRAMVGAASAWIRVHPGSGREFRFDVIGVTIPPSGPPEIVHIVDAFTGDDVW